MDTRRRLGALAGAVGAVVGRPIVALAVVAGGVGVAWLVPPLAIVTIWPLLFVVPGWLIVRRVAPDLEAPGRVGLAVVVSTVVAAHATNLAAVLAGGFDRGIALVAAGAVAISSVAVGRLHGPAGDHAAEAPEPAKPDPGQRGAWLAAAMGATVVGTVLAASAWHEVAGDVVSGGWNWSDFLVHVAIGGSIAAGNFPPQVPYAAGAPLSYHWFADFHGAIAALTAGLDIIPVFIIASAALAGAFVLLVWQLATALLGDRRVSTWAALLALFGGGLGWIRLPLDVTRTTGDLAVLLSTTPYDNTWTGDWPLFRIASVLGTGFLAHRATAFGLPILVGVVLLAHLSLGRRRVGMLAAGTLAALLAPFHFYFLPAAYLLVGLLMVARRAWRLPRWWHDAVLFLGPAALAAPFIVGPILLQQGRGAFRFTPGWGEAPFDVGPLEVVFFYLTNLGLPAILAALAIVRPGRVPARAFLGSWAVALFIVPNVVVVGAVEFDMNKYFQAMWVAVALLAAWSIRTWPRPAIMVVLLVSALSPALVAVWHVTSTTVVLTGAQERAARWIAAATPPRSVFVTEAWINSPVDLAGRLRITSFGPYVANLGLDADARAADVHAVYCDGEAAAVEVMRRYDARYVLSPGGLLDCAASPTDFSSSSHFATVYAADGVTVWERRP